MAWKLSGDAGRVHRISLVTRKKQPVPEWAYNTAFLCFIARSKSTSKTRRNAEIAYLFWRMGFTERDLAEEFGVSGGAVRELIKRMRRKGDALYGKR